MSILVPLADAIVAALNAQPWLPEAAERKFRVRWDLEELTRLRIAVVPRTLVYRPLDRDRDIVEATVEIAVQQKIIVASEDQEVAALVALLEAIARHFRPGRRFNPLPSAVTAKVVLAANQPYVIEHLDELTAFNGSVLVTCEVVEE